MWFLGRISESHNKANKSRGAYLETDTIRSFMQSKLLRILQATILDYVKRETGRSYDN